MYVKILAFAAMLAGAASFSISPMTAHRGISLSLRSSERSSVCRGISGLNMAVKDINSANDLDNVIASAGLN